MSLLTVSLLTASRLMANLITKMSLLTVSLLTANLLMANLMSSLLTVSLLTANLLMANLMASLLTVSLLTANLLMANLMASLLTVSLLTANLFMTNLMSSLPMASLLMLARLIRPNRPRRTLHPTPMTVPIRHCGEMGITATRWGRRRTPAAPSIRIELHRRSASITASITSTNSAAREAMLTTRPDAGCSARTPSTGDKTLLADNLGMLHGAVRIQTPFYRPCMDFMPRPVAWMRGVMWVFRCGVRVWVGVDKVAYSSTRGRPVCS